MKKPIKKTAPKTKKPAVRKSKPVKKTGLKKKATKAVKTPINKTKSIRTLPENDVKARIHKEIKEIDKKLDEVKLMVHGYRKIKIPHWGHFGSLARILITLNEIC